MTFLSAFIVKVSEFLADFQVSEERSAHLI